MKNYGNTTCNSSWAWANKWWENSLICVLSQRISSYIQYLCKGSVFHKVLSCEDDGWWRGSRFYSLVSRLSRWMNSIFSAVSGFWQRISSRSSAVGVVRTAVELIHRRPVHVAGVFLMSALIGRLGYSYLFGPTFRTVIILTVAAGVVFFLHQILNVEILHAAMNNSKTVTFARWLLTLDETGGCDESDCRK